jgi:ATP-dependent helicase HrpA
VRPGFVLAAGIDRLADVERYVEAIGYRLDHLAGAVERDRRRLEEVARLEATYARLVEALPPAAAAPELGELAWTLEELRVATFAEPLGAKGHVSVTRVRRALSALTAH